MYYLPGKATYTGDNDITHNTEFSECKNFFCTGVGSMGAPGAGAPMKFLSGTQCHTAITLKCLIFILSISVNIGTRAPVYQI